MSEPETLGSTWYAANAPSLPERDPLGVDRDVDVCIVGGGLAGLTAARELALRGWSVVLLEARRVAWNASGRNAGFVLPGFAALEDDLIARIGLDRTKALWKLSEEGVEYVRRTIRAEKMRGVDLVPGWLAVSQRDHSDQVAQQHRLLRRSLNAEVEYWPTEKVRASLRSERYFQALHFPRAFHINPLQYALGLAAAAEKAGARIYEDTPVLGVDAAGIRKRIVTPRARLRAEHVVLAGNVHLGRIAPSLRETLLPIWTYVAVTAPLGERLAEAIAYRGAVSDGDGADNHYRVVGGDRLLWSGRLTTWDATPSARAAALRASLRRTFPQLGDVVFDHVWSGVLGRTVHGMPQVGELSPGVWLASGFSGHGLNTTAMAGNLIARAIHESDDAWRQFLPFELVWAGGLGGRVAVQALYWGKRAAERATGPAARLRDRVWKVDSATAEHVAIVEPAATAEDRGPPKTVSRKRRVAPLVADRVAARRRKKVTAGEEAARRPEPSADETV